MAVVYLFNTPISVRLPPDLNACSTGSFITACVLLMTDGDRDLGITLIKPIIFVADGLLSIKIIIFPPNFGDLNNEHAHHFTLVFYLCSYNSEVIPETYTWRKTLQWPISFCSFGSVKSCIVRRTYYKKKPNQH